MSREEINENYPEVIVFDGFDEAIIGMGERIGMEPVVSYDVNKIIEILMKSHDMDNMEAIEYFEFNIKGMWINDYTPLLIYK